MNSHVISSSLAALRHWRSVFGVLFTNGHDMLYQDTDLTEERLVELVVHLDDIAYYFEQEKRNPDQISFGYDGGNLLLLLRGDLRLVLFHHDVAEVDELARAAAAFLKDYGMSALVENRVSGSVPA